MSNRKEKIEVIPVQYKLTKERKYRYATTIRNLKTNTQVTIDNKTLQPVHSPDCDYWVNLVIAIGHVFFDFNNPII